MWSAKSTPITSGCAAAPDPVLPGPRPAWPSVLPGAIRPAWPLRPAWPRPGLSCHTEGTARVYLLPCGTAVWRRSVGSTVQVSEVNGAGQWGQRCRSVGSAVQVSEVNGAGQFLRWGPAPLKRLGWRFPAPVSRAKSDLRHPCYRPAPLGLQTCAIHPSDPRHRLPVSVPNAARGRVAPPLNCRKRAGAGRLTVQLVLLWALRPVTSSNNVRHARLRSGAHPSPPFSLACFPP